MKEKINEIIIKAGLFFNRTVNEFSEDNRGVGVVELVLIIVVLVGLVVIFKDQLTGILTSIFTRIANESAAL